MEGNISQRFDHILLDQTYYTKEGYLVDHPIVTTVGIFLYQRPDGSIRRELRLPEEVFSAESLASYEGKPVIVTHEVELVDKDNVNQEIIGTILSAGYQDGSSVRTKIIIHETNVMALSGLRELSLGYQLTLDETPGEWDGMPYDAIQRNIRINHLALVAKARAGETARLNIDGEDNSPAEGGDYMATKKVRNDGMAPEELQAAIEAYKARKNERKTTGMELGNSHQDLPNAVPNEKKQDQSEVEEAIQTVKDRRDRRDAQEDPKETSEAMSVIAQQDEDIDNLLQTISKLLAQKDFDAAEGQKAVDNESGPTDAKSEESKTEGLNMDSADHLIRSRLEVARLGDKLHLDGLEALPLHEAKKRIILAVRPEIRLDGKDSAYIRAAYDIAREEVNRRKDINHQRAQMFNPIIARMDGSTSKSAALTARERMIQKLRGEND